MEEDSPDRPSAVHPLAHRQDFEDDDHRIVSVPVHQSQEDERLGAIIQILRTENARALEKEKHEIIHQVVHQLQQSRIFEQSKSTKKKKKSSSDKQNRGIQRLLSQALDEDGLMLPHVQQQQQSLQHENIPTKIGGRRAGGRKKKKNTLQLLTFENPTPIYHGPLRSSTHQRKVVMSTREKTTTSIERIVCHDDDNHSGDQEQVFEVDPMTAVMIERSRRLVARAGKLQRYKKKSTSASRKVSSSTSSLGVFVNHPDPKPRTPEALDQHQNNIEEDKEVDKERISLNDHDQEEEEDAITLFNDLVRQKAQDRDHPRDDESSDVVSKEQDESSDHEKPQPPPLILRPDTTGFSRPDSLMSTDTISSRHFSIEKQPNAHPHDYIDQDDDKLSSSPPLNVCQVLNEDDWENEMARQILFLYTSSNNQMKQQPAASTTTAPVAEPCSPPHLPPVLVAPRSKSKSKIHTSWKPSHVAKDGQVIITRPKFPRPIWFSGSGSVRAIWCNLATTSSNASLPLLAGPCEHGLCRDLRDLESSCQFTKYLMIVQALVLTRVRTQGQVELLDEQLWKQLIVTTNAFVTRCVDLGHFSTALALLKSAQVWMDQHPRLLPSHAGQMELRAFLFDNYAHYYLQRGKARAGMQYLQRALDIHRRQSDFGHLAKVLLHQSVLWSKARDHVQAKAGLEEILRLVENQQLESGGASAQKICLVAVCYHNLAIEQLHAHAAEKKNTQHLQQALLSSQNAHRLARLCLSYSNRWIKEFEHTHKVILQAIDSYMN